MVTYGEILRMASIKVNGFSGTTASALNAAYLTTPLTATQLGDVNFTIAMLIDSLVSTVGRIIRAYASTPNHPYRSFNLSQTANIANMGLIPSTDASSNPIVGVYGAIRDASDGKEMTEQPIQLIETIRDDTSLKLAYYHFKIVDARLVHTRTNAVIDVCTFNATTARTSANINGSVPIPDALLDCAVDGLISKLFIDDEWGQQASACAQAFEAGLQRMVGGEASYSPAPVLVSSQQPTIS